MTAPSKYPNLSNAGMGRPQKGKRRRLSISIAPNVAAYLEKLGGSPRKISEAIEQLVMEKINMPGIYMTESASALKIDGANIGDIISLDDVQYSIHEWDDDKVTLRELAPDEQVKAEFVFCHRAS